MKAPILIIDDNADMRSLMQLYLKSEGYSVATASDGGMALEQLHAGLKPGLIFVDMIMKGIDGRAFLKHFETELPGVFASTPIVATSGLEEAKDLKISHYLKKPVELAVIKQTVDRFYVSH